MLESEYGIILAERNFLAIPTDVTDMWAKPSWTLQPAPPWAEYHQVTH